MLTFHWDNQGIMRCSFCQRPALECNVWAKEPCVERAALDIISATATVAWPD